MGTMIGLGFAKTESSRQGILQCADPSELLDCIRQHGTNYQRGGIAAIENAFLGVNMGSNSSHTSSGRDLTTNLENWFTSSSVGGDMNLAAGVQRAYREMFFAGNIWYARQFNRLRICDIVANLDGDLSSSNILNLKKFKKFLKERIGEQAGLISARQMIDLLISPILYTYVTIPCPMFDPEAKNIGLHSTEANEGDLADTLGKVVNTYTTWKEAGLNYILFKPDSQFFPPPCCNLIFPHMYQSFTYSRSFTQEPTRAILRTEDLIKPTSYKTAPTATRSGGTSSASGVVGDQAMISPPVWRTSYPKRMKDRLYAPDFESFSVLMDTGSSGGYHARLHAVELPHEFYVGPTFFFSFADMLGRYASTNDRRKYLSFFTDYIYWKARFSSRPGSLRLGFTPNLIPGHSTVIFDRNNKHYVGYISSLTHTINQSGGTTTVTLTCVREHDEDIDFDKKGRTQEEIIFGSLDPDGDGDKPSFYDERYGLNRIGPEVYEPLFGTKAIIDHHGDLVTQSATGLSMDEVATYGDKTVANTIEVLFKQYQVAISSGLNLTEWTQYYTHRPKATLVDILGINLDDPNWVPFPDSDVPEFGEFSTVSASGFMEHVFTKSTAAGLTYESIDRRTITSHSTSTVREGYVRFAPLISDGDSAIIREYRDRVVTSSSSRTVDSGEPGVSYDLGVEAEARGGQVKIYVDSLLYKGLRG
jgi:hypothetical protein